MGQAAEKAGKNREALTQYVTALQSATEGSPDDQRLREKIIQIVQKLDPPPAIPEEASRLMARGRAAVKIAADEQGFLKATEEFRQALRLVPWLAEGYYNLGVLQDKAGRHADAIRNLKLYLLATPNASDAGQVRDLIYEIEYRAEETPKIQAQQQAQEQKSKLQSLAGTWDVAIQSNDLHSWGTFTMTMKDETTIEGHQTITSFQIEGYQRSYNSPSDQRPLLVLRGTLKGPDIQWEAWVDPIYPECKSWQGFKQITVSISADQRRLSFQNPAVALYPAGCREQLYDYVLTRS